MTTRAKKRSTAAVGILPNSSSIDNAHGAVRDHSANDDEEHRGFLEGFSEGDMRDMPFRRQSDVAAQNIASDRNIDPNDLSLVSQQGKLAEDVRKHSKHSKRLRNIALVLEKQEEMPERDKQGILLTVLHMEKDLALAKRRLGQNKSVVTNTKSHQKELNRKIATLEENIGSLQEAIETKERVIRSLRQQASAYAADVEHLQDENEVLHKRQSIIMTEQETHTMCEFVCASRAFGPSRAMALQLEKEELRKKRRQAAMQAHAEKKKGRRKSRASPTRKNSKKSLMAGSPGKSLPDLFAADNADFITTHPKVPLVHDPAETILELISQSTTSIEVMCHSFTSLRVAAALSAASSRGVSVRVMLDAAWLELALKSTMAYRPNQCWQAIYKKWTSSGVHFQPQHGQLMASVPKPIYAPFRHNAIVFDGQIFATGPFPFSEEDVDVDSNLVVVKAFGGEKNDCIHATLELFETLWTTPALTEYSTKTTTVKLPPV